MKLFSFTLLTLLFCSVSMAAPKKVSFMDITKLTEVQNADKVIVFFPKVYLPKNLKKYESSFRAHMTHLFFGLGEIQVSYANPPKKKYPQRFTMEKSKELKKAPDLIIDASNKKEYEEEIKAYERKEEKFVEYQFISKVTKSKTGYVFTFSLTNPYSQETFYQSPTFTTKNSLQDLVHKMRVNGYGFFRGKRAMTEAVENGFLKERKYALLPPRKKKVVIAKRTPYRRKVSPIRGTVRIFSVPAGISYRIGKTIKGKTNNEHNLPPGKYELTIFNKLTKKPEKYPFEVIRDQTKFFSFDFQKPVDPEGVVASVGKILKEEDYIKDEAWVGLSKEEMEQYYEDLRLLKEAEMAEKERWDKVKKKDLIAKDDIPERSNEPKIYIAVGFRYLGAQPSTTSGSGPIQAFELEGGIDHPIWGWKFGFGQNSINFTNSSDTLTYQKKYRYLSAAREFGWLNNLLGTSWLKFDYMARLGLASYFMIEAAEDKSAFLGSVGGQIILWNTVRLVFDFEFTVGVLPPPYAENGPLFSPAVSVAVGFGF